MIGNPWQEIVGTPISPEAAWRVLDDWKAKRKEIGVLFCGRSGTAVIAAMCTVRPARNGLLQMKGDSAGASLNLKLAKFSYGPMQVWPHWPAGPTAEVLALQAYLATGDWLVLAEGYFAQGIGAAGLADVIRRRDATSGCAGSPADPYETIATTGLPSDRARQQCESAGD